MRTINSNGLMAMIAGLMFSPDAPAATTAPAKVEEPKQTIAQKVDALNTEKSSLAAQLQTMAADAPERAGIQDRITVIDRKVRWYAGRSGEAKTARPSKAGSKSKDKAKVTAPAAAPTSAPAPVSAANES